MTDEVYKLECACGETIQIPLDARQCPKCEVNLTINWHALAEESAATEPADVRPFEHTRP